MRSARLLLSGMLLLLAGVPASSYGLTVKITASRPGTTPVTTTLPPAIGTTPGTRTVSLSNVSVNGFTFTPTASTSAPRVVADVAGGVERILMVNTTIKGPSICSSTARCTITLTASSDNNDYPKKGPGGYPSGTFVSVINTTAVGLVAVGNTVSVTGRARASGTILDPINTTPGAGTGDTATSLPKACTGKTSCLFTAAQTNGGSFNEQISETIQLQCGTSLCDPAKDFSVTVVFTHSNDKATFGIGTAQSTTPTVTTNFVGALLPNFSSFTPRLQITGTSKFQLRIPFTLNAGTNGIAPTLEFVNFTLTPQFGTPYSDTIPPGSFKQIKPNEFAFDGVINNAMLRAKFIALGGNKYEFRVDATGSGLLAGAQNPVCVALTIEDDTSGGNCVLAEFK